MKDMASKPIAPKVTVFLAGIALLIVALLTAPIVVYESPAHLAGAVLGAGASAWSVLA